jgi:hypothetical protein
MYYHYEISNPNHIQIDTNKEYTIIPFGHRCTPALACKFANLRKMSLPFDWANHLFGKNIKMIIENQFNDFIPNVREHQFCNKYGITFEHFNHDVEEGIAEYTRRIERWFRIMNDTTTKYFIYINEDYLDKPEFRSETFNDAKFSEMVELEQFLKMEYPSMEYAILYFNCRKHTIPADSNIINIVFDPDNIPENRIEEFRYECGEILSKLFHTSMSPGYTYELFHL